MLFLREVSGSLFSLAQNRLPLGIQIVSVSKRKSSFIDITEYTIGTLIVIQIFRECQKSSADIYN